MLFPTKLQIFTGFINLGKEIQMDQTVHVISTEALLKIKVDAFFAIPCK